MNRTNLNKSGFALIDALVGVAVVAILCTAFLSSIHQANLASSFSRDRLSASIATLDMYETAVHLAQKNYLELHNNLYTCSSDCHFLYDGSNWIVQAGKETINHGHLTRYFTLNSVSRDGGSNDIVTSGGVSDVDTLQLVITVEWTNRGNDQTETTTTYLHNMNI